MLSAVVAPTDLIKCRVQDGQYSGPIEAVKDVYKRNGLAGFGRGMHATMLREVPGNALFFMTYESAQLAFPRFVAEQESSSESVSGTQSKDAFDKGARARHYWAQETLAAVSCGGVAGSVFWITMLPVDYAKTRLQIARAGDRDDASVARLIVRTARERGWRGLYSGAWPTLLRAFPANAAQFLAWELACQAAGSRRIVRGEVNDQDRASSREVGK